MARHDAKPCDAVLVNLLLWNQRGGNWNSGFVTCLKSNFGLVISPLLIFTFLMCRRGKWYYQPPTANVRIKAIRFVEYVAWCTISMLQVSVTVIIMKML